MKNILGILTFLFLVTQSSISQTTDTKAVKQTFEKYKTAILNDQGESALHAVDSRTQKYYNDILLMVKNADSMEIVKLSLIDKITVFSIRHRATKEEIENMDGNGLFIYAIKKGMVGKNSVVNNTIGEVTVDGTFAKGQLVVSGQKTPYYFHFYKESNEWKLDLTSLFPLSNTALKQMVNQSGENENEFIFSLLEMITGTRPGTEIWQKLN